MIKSITTSFLLIISTSLFAGGGTLSPPDVGTFDMTPEPITCTGANDKITWTGSAWACAKDQLAAVADKNMPFTVVFARRSMHTSWGQYVAAYSPPAGYYYGVPMKPNGTTTYCSKPGARGTCLGYSTIQKWQQMSLSEFNTYRNNGYKVWARWGSTFSCGSNCSFYH